MNDRPMGFGPPGPSDPDDGDESVGGSSSDPFSELFAGGDPEAMARALQAAGAGDVDADQVRAMMGQVQKLLSTPGDGGPVNWQLAGDVARQVVSEHGDATVGQAEQRAVDEALRLADTWLTEATTLPAAGARGLAWSSAEWVEGTKPVWRRLVEPVAESVARALSDALAKQIPPELAGPMAASGPGGPGEAMMRQIGGSVFGLQVGQAIGTLATEVVSGTEIGLPLVEPGVVVLVPAGVAAFGEGLDVPADEVRLYLAVREAARSRLFAHVPWLSAALLGDVEAYARGIAIDTERIESALRETDPSDAESMQQALASGLFEPERTPAQQVALDRLETSLALLEGWVEVVTDAAASTLPHADGLRETVRRRRAIGGPAEQTFSALVGLELRPRRLRDAAALWRVIGDTQGIEARDGVWSHPDLMPTAEDLDDPLGYAERRAQADAGSAAVDAAIEQLLSGESGPSDPA
ncbi:zinc-dependent metalloprotease [Angustibacter luteus]|uniref:Zinc-dependent metalloprotease n=1 Tax=Angustibacter luteus TaxID=658456 RepID=A0ABW1JH87_9ACTN